MNQNDTVDTLNSLLRGEISATETYQQAIAKFANDSGVEDLKRIHVEHREAANTLRQHVHQVGGKPDQGSGAWGAFAKATEGAATMMGNKAALMALKQGEESGLSSYESALKKSLPNECASLIRDQLMPQTRNHLPVLDRLMGTDKK